jgi:hypothetical protein
MQGDSRGRVPLLFLAYDDFFRSAKLNEKYDCQNPSGKRVYANEAGGASFSKSGSIAPIQQKSLFVNLFERIKGQIEISQR